MTGPVREVEVELGDRVSAGDVLASLDTTILEANLAATRADVAAAQAQLNYLIRQGQDEVHLQSARADIERADAAVRAAEARLGQASLRAPFDGTVAAISIAPGETAYPELIAITLGDLSAFVVETTDLGERQVPLVRVGQAADVHVPALDETFVGSVADIGRISESLGGDVVYRVRIVLQSPPTGLRWGMTAEVSIIETE
jgi:multidrug resistance efflux pump